jgi:hypothetical protein
MSPEAALIKEMETATFFTLFLRALNPIDHHLAQRATSKNGDIRVLNKTSIALCLTAILCSASVARAESKFYQQPSKSTAKHQVARHEPVGYVARDRDDPPGAEFQTEGLNYDD